MRRMLLAFLVVAAAATAPAARLAAQDEARFRWQNGQALTYKVEQKTAITETVADKKTTVGSTLSLVKRWTVKEVDDAGTATLELQLVSMKNEITRPDGEVLKFDSADLDKSTAEMKEQMGKFLGVPLALIKVDARGLVAEVKESQHGPASRFESDLPFKVALPGVKLESGLAWKRNYQITLAPPQGTGEKYDASQQYTCKGVDGPLATVAFATTLASPPEGAMDQIPLLQMQPEGEAVVDLKTGALRSAAYKIDREVKGHQGENSTYQFQTTYSEELVEAK